MVVLAAMMNAGSDPLFYPALTSNPNCTGAQMNGYRIERRGMENSSITKEDVARWLTILEVPTCDEMALFDHATTISS
jgi:hypothetical protein